MFTTMPPTLAALNPLTPESWNFVFYAGHQTWYDMFHLGLPIFEKVLRTIVVYLLLMIGLRTAGKRELAQLNPFDLIVLLMLSNTVQNAIIGDDNSVTGGAIGALTLLLVNYSIVRLTYRSRKLQRLLGGKPDVLVKDGHVIREHCQEEMITTAELKAAAHKQGIATLKEVERAVLEPTGTISFITRKPTPDTQRHDELLNLLTRIAKDLNDLKAPSKPNEATAAS
jgi:uncharacterized membrane protein YcaP (DUF421 family)